jgi:nitric oxide reductase subunit B
MADTLTERLEPLSSWLRVAAIVTMAAGFAVLILLTVTAYQNAPPIPDKFVDPAGAAVFTADEVVAGQQVFLKHGLMDNGTIWGHGGYLGPDFSAQSLHILARDLAERIARERLSRGYGDLTAEERAAVDGAVALKANRYDPTSGTLALPAGAAGSFNGQVEYWTRYFGGPERNGGLTRDTVSDPRELRQLTAFFAWTGWASAATRPGTSHSYTNNFPYEPLAGNTPTANALIYSALSLVFLLGGTAAVLLAFGKFDYLGWHRRAVVAARAAALPVSDAQRETLKFMAIAALLFFGQTLIGGGVAHYRADPGSFYGIDLARLLPSNLLRTWHLQLAILWIATAYVGGALFVAGSWAAPSPPGNAAPFTCCSPLSSWLLSEACSASGPGSFNG